MSTVSIDTSKRNKKKLKMRIKVIKNELNVLQDIIYIKTNEINGNLYENPMPSIYNKITMLNIEQEKKIIFTNNLLKKLKQRKKTNNIYMIKKHSRTVNDNKTNDIKNTNQTKMYIDNKYKVIEEEIVLPSY